MASISPLKTVDNWGTDNTQCLVPGYGAPNLYVPGTSYGTMAPSSYPITYDQKGACGQVKERDPYLPLWLFLSLQL